MKVESLAKLLKDDVFFERYCDPFSIPEVVNMPDELSEVIINEDKTIVREAYKRILNNEVINKTRSITEIVSLFETLSKTKEKLLLNFITRIVIPATFSENRQDNIDDIINELAYISKFDLAKIDRLYSFYSGLNLQRSASDRLTILNAFENKFLHNTYILPAFIKIINDENIFRYRNSTEVVEMLHCIEYCSSEEQSEYTLLVLFNQRLLKDITCDEQLSILELADKYEPEKGRSIAKASCLLDLGSYDDNMNILLEMAEERDINKFKAMYDYIEQLYGDDEQDEVTYDRVIGKINDISPTIELSFNNSYDMKKLCKFLEASHIDHFDTNTEVFAKNDRGRVQKVKFKY